ncbi:MAG: aminotransferase class I/II-fold pyridoxal phosphate-dependent enzyme [Acidobacteriaceae bacterium]|nr:aminotransferase class I/II-fold pyridoxal phosphate-dependent enzyme [Acidobacteriaceae bacterium]
MQLAPFLLDEWLDQKNLPNARIEFDLGSSTGPAWTLGELLALGAPDEAGPLTDLKLLYTAAAGSLPLRQGIAALEGVEPDDVQVTTGGAEALLILFFLAAEPGANVILPHPGFPPDKSIAESLGVEVRSYNLRRENEFRIDPGEVLSLIDDNTRLLLVNSPHNPTGSVLTAHALETLHDSCENRGVQFVCDQVYHPIYHGPASPSAARLPRATVLGDFSKALCLSGLRVGWIVERDPERRKQYRNARSHFTVSNTALGEHLAAFAVRHSGAIYDRALSVSQRNLALVDEVVRENQDLIRWVRPQGGMTALPWLSEGGDARAFCQRLLPHGILLAPGDCFGMPDHFRLGFGATAEKFGAALERFAEVLKSQAREPSPA